jgi:hypothetical protein
MEYFDFIKLFFTANDKEYNEKVTKMDKTNYFIPLINLISKKYPEIVNSVNIEIFYSFPDVAVDFLRMILKNNSGKTVPKWVYYKTKEEIKKEENTAETIEKFITYFNIDKKILEDYLFVFGENGKREIIEKVEFLEKISVQK